MGEAGWSVAKKEWCCMNKEIACTTTLIPKQVLVPGPGPDATTTSEPYDCTAGYSNWRAGWSDDKKAYCCTHRNMGCAETTSEPYDCNAGYSNWRAGWSADKKVWCCQNKHMGCK